MSNEEIAIYKKIELMQEYINAECEGYIYSPTDKDYQIFLRIKHIVDSLCKNALVLLKQHKTLFKGNAQNLSLQQTEQLLRQIYLCCALPNTPGEKNNAITEILRKFNLHDDLFFIQYR